MAENTRNHNGMTLGQAEQLLVHISRLRAELAAARLQSANRLAAMRAALAAYADGEDEPLEYLRMETGDYPPAGRGRP